MGRDLVFLYFTSERQDAHLTGFRSTLVVAHELISRQLRQRCVCVFFSGDVLSLISSAYSYIITETTNGEYHTPTHFTVAGESGCVHPLLLTPQKTTTELPSTAATSMHAAGRTVSRGVTVGLNVARHRLGQQRVHNKAGLTMVVPQPGDCIRTSGNESSLGCLSCRCQLRSCQALHCTHMQNSRARAFRARTLA